MKSTKINRSIYVIVLVLILHAIWTEYNSVTPKYHNPQGLNISSDNISVCFTPPSGCAEVIASHIAEANTTIYLQAYGLTSKKIIGQLIEASQRGVKVRMLLDSSNFSEKKIVVDDLTRVGIEITRDSISGIAHNKVMIIDGLEVITGSFNFTEAADKRNAENVIFIKDKKVAGEYLENWNRRKEASK